MKKKMNIRKITVAAVMSAISITLAITPLGMIPLPFASATILHIPVIIGAILEGPVVGVIVGLIFGISSLIKAATTPVGPIDPYFVNPLISVFPRIMIGLTTWAVYKGIKRWEVPAIVTASAVGSLTNTVLVMSALALFSGIDWSAMVKMDFMPFFLTILTTHGIMEAVVAALISTTVIVAWKRIETGKKGSSLEDIDGERA